MPSPAQPAVMARPDRAVCQRWEKVSKFSRDVSAWSVTTFQVVTLAHRLHQEFMKTEPGRRGRASTFMGCGCRLYESNKLAIQLRPMVRFLMRTGAETYAPRKLRLCVKFEAEKGNPERPGSLEGEGSVSWVRIQNPGRNPSP